MIRKIINDIVHTGDYSNGGINKVFLLDINDFRSYRFRDDQLYDSCYVEQIYTEENFFSELEAVDESFFNESQSNGLYRQELSTFIRTIEAPKSSDLLRASVTKYLVAFRNTQGRTYCFGSDGGATIQFSQVSGKVGEVTGYQITIVKDSMFPLFEVDPEVFQIRLLGTENRLVISTEDNINYIRLK